MPGNGEHHTSVFGMRHENSIGARQKRPVQYYMRPLTWRDDLMGIRFRQTTNGVGKDAGSVDDDFCLRAERLTRFDVLPTDAVQDPSLPLFSPVTFA